MNRIIVFLVFALMSAASFADTYTYFGPFGSASPPTYYFDAATACPAAGSAVTTYAPYVSSGNYTCTFSDPDPSVMDFDICSGTPDHAYPGGGSSNCTQVLRVGPATITCDSSQTPDWTKYPLVCSTPPPQQDCSSKTGQDAGTYLQTCVIVKCSGGATFVKGSDGLIACSSGSYSSIYPDVPQTISASGCEALYSSKVVRPGPDGVHAAFPVSQIGQSSASIDCEVTYTYSGLPSSDSTPSAPSSSSGSASDSSADSLSGDDTGAGSGTGTGTGDSTGTGTGDGAGTGSGSGSGNGNSTCTTDQQAAGRCVQPTPVPNCSTDQQAAGTCVSDSYTGVDNCDAPPQCTGDAVQCGIITQEWKDYCASVKITDDQKTQAQADIDQANSDYVQYKQDKDNRVDSYFSTFQSDLSNAYSSGECPLDSHFSLFGHDVTLPFSEACDFFRFLRVIVIVFAQLAAARIISHAM